MARRVAVMSVPDHELLWGLLLPLRHRLDLLVDALAARMVSDPGSLDVVVASNLFADVLTDLAAARGSPTRPARSGAPR
jgi:hypothetical protein